MVAGEGTVLHGERTVVEDTAAASECPIVREGTVFDGERAAVTDASTKDTPATRRVRLTVLDRHATNRDRAAGDHQHRTVTTAVDNGAFPSLAANGDVAVDRHELVVGPRRDVDGGARCSIDRRLDGRIGASGHVAG